MKTIAQILSAMAEARELLPENSKTITSIAAPNVYTPKATAFARRTIAMLRSSDSSVFRRRKTEESDERSIAIVRRANAVAFGVYTFGAAILVIVLEFSGKSSLASAIALNICAIVFIYWLSYIILQKRS